MQGFFEAQRRGAGIGADKLQPELGTKGDAMYKPKFRWPPAPGLIIALDKHADRNCAFVLHDRLELPGSCAHKSMGWSVGVIYLSAKPGKADWNAASDRLAVLPARLRAREKQFLVPRWLPGGHVGAVKIHLAFPT
jgi:hypothetical protein